MTTLRERILAARDIRSELVTVPEWDGVTLEMRGLTAAERQRALKAGTDPTGEIDTERLFPAMLAGCLYDPDTGERVFTLADAEAVMGKAADVVDRLVQAAMRLSGMTTGKTDSEGEPITPVDDEGKAS